MIHEYQGKKPEIDRSVFVAESAEIIGNVRIGKDSSVWFNTVIRGDIGSIVIKNNTSIQDLCVLHVTETAPIEIGMNVTVGHAAILHGCTIGDNSLIGMGATILDNVVIGKNCIVAAGSVVLENTTIPDNSLVAGIPAKIKKSITAEDAEHLKEHALKYVKYSKTYL